MSSDEFRPLTAVQHRVIAYRVAGMSWEDAAKSAGVTSRGVRKWRTGTDPSFNNELARVEADHVETSRAILRCHAADLTRALVDIACDPKQPAAARVSAIDKALARVGVIAETKSETTATVEHSGEVGLRKVVERTREEIDGAGERLFERAQGVQGVG